MLTIAGCALAKGVKSDLLAVGFQGFKPLQHVFCRTVIPVPYQQQMLFFVLIFDSICVYGRIPCYPHTGSRWFVYHEPAIQTFSSLQSRMCMVPVETM